MISQSAYFSRSAKKDWVDGETHFSIRAAQRSGTLIIVWSEGGPVFYVYSKPAGLNPAPEVILRVIRYLLSVYLGSGRFMVNTLTWVVRP
jgi:hypothetical protein